AGKVPASNERRAQMKSRKAFVSCVGILGTLGLVVAMPVGAAPKMQTIAITSVQVSQAKVGGKYVIKDNDFILRKQVGHDQLTCSQTRCGIVLTFTTVLQPGTITGWFKPVGTSGTGTITGGTGSYAKATGGFSWKNLNKAGSRTAVTLSIE